jgi:RecA/RadA recombinase
MAKSMKKQLKDSVKTPVKEKKKRKGTTDIMISTGSTTLDLAISGGRVRGGGVPLGILMEVRGLSGLGKSTLLCEMGGDVLRKKGKIGYDDNEGRITNNFANIYGLDLSDAEYNRSDTVTEMFSRIKKFSEKDAPILGYFSDSIAALSTSMEMDTDGGDKMGGRKAKELSQELRKITRLISDTNILLAVSNQLRMTMASFGKKYTTSGGMAINYYASLILEMTKPLQNHFYYTEVETEGKKVKIQRGIKTSVDVVKSSIWKPHRNAFVYIDPDYGIDDLRGNLQFIKDYTDNDMYTLDGVEKLHTSMDKSIKMVEDGDLEDILKNATIDLWETIEARSIVKRKPKKR